MRKWPNTGEVGTSFVMVDGRLRAIRLVFFQGGYRFTRRGVGSPGRWLWGRPYAPFPPGAFGLRKGEWVKI